MSVWVTPVPLASDPDRKSTDRNQTEPPRGNLNRARTARVLTVAAVLVSFSSTWIEPQTSIVRPEVASTLSARPQMVPEEPRISSFGSSEGATVNVGLAQIPPCVPTYFVKSTRLDPKKEKRRNQISKINEVIYAFLVLFTRSWNLSVSL